MKSRLFAKQEGNHPLNAWFWSEIWQKIAKDDPKCTSQVHQGLQMGYRLIDTASHYENEAEVGRAIRRSGVPREELQVVTKARRPFSWPFFLF